MKQKVIYIAGLGHSGTTILDMLLGAHPDIVGLGEVKATLQQNFEDIHKKKVIHICSCGKDMSECDFWSGFMKLNVSENASFVNRYENLLRYALNTKGIKIILDSSKNSNSYLEFLKTNYDLRVIFIVRDFRSWIYSRFTRTKMPVLYLGYRWWLENLKIMFKIKKMGIDFQVVGYEELCVFPEFILNKICSFSGIDFSPAMLSPDNTGSHIVLGNIARVDKDKRSKIFYDMRWMVSTRLNLLLPLFFPLFRWNRKHVYSNVMHKKTVAFNKRQSDFFLFGNKKKELLIHQYEKTQHKSEQ